MGRNFLQTLKEGRIDIKREYSKIYGLFYGEGRDGRSLADQISMNFLEYPFRGTCIDLEEFDEIHGICFEENPDNLDSDYLVRFCEYVFNFVKFTDSRFFYDYFNKSFHLEQIRKVVESIGYMEIEEEGITLFVPRDNAVIEVSTSKYIPINASYKLISYGMMR